MINSECKHLRTWAECSTTYDGRTLESGAKIKYVLPADSNSSAFTKNIIYEGF